MLAAGARVQAAVLVGRRLVFPAQSGAAVRADMTTQVQFEAAGGTTAMRTVSLMFPANCRTVVRLMEAWYDAQVGLSMLAGRHFVYIMEEGQQAAPPLQLGGGGKSFVPPHEPVPCCCCLGAQLFSQMSSRSLHWLWPCHAAKRHSLFLAHCSHFHTVITRGPASHHKQQLMACCFAMAMHQSNPPSSLRTFHLPHCHHKRGPGTI
jgi:hypothetical protein